MMSYEEVVTSLNSNQLFVQKSLKQDNNKPIPKWLLEFDGFTEKECKLSEIKQSQSRPLTESHLFNRPKWFEELSQKRRMSDISSMSYTDVNNSNQFDEHCEETYCSNRKMNQIHLPTERKSSSEYLPEDFKTNSDSRNSSSDSSKTSSNLNDMILDDDDIFTFTTTKSFENLKVDEKAFEFDEEFVIPEMPCGNELTMVLADNWGDENYVGFNGIEILDPSGNRPLMKNILMEDSGNNRFISSDLKKLVDNVYRTHDDSHIWQYRINKKQFPIRITLQFDKPLTIALIRIWNFNKSRIHSYRGIRSVKIELNEKVIFSGEIARATGDLTGSVENFGDTILFTTDESVLEQISHHDLSFQELLRD